MPRTIAQRTEALKRATPANATHLNEALQIIADQQDEIARLNRVVTEWERDMKGTLATLEAERGKNAGTPGMLEALQAADEALTHSMPIMRHYPEPVARHLAAIEKVWKALTTRKVAA